MTPPTTLLWRIVLPWVLAGGLALGLLAALWAPWRKAPYARQLRLSIEIGAEGSLLGTAPELSLSPDGSMLAFVAMLKGAGPQSSQL